jgi:hypothetical protein
MNRFKIEEGHSFIQLFLPEAFIFALTQRRSRKVKAAFYLHPVFSSHLNSDG